MSGRGDEGRAAVERVLEALVLRHGYDFRGYARPSLHRRVHELAKRLECDGVAALAELILADASVLPEVLAGLSVPVTEMFRDPQVFAALRQRVFPRLADRPRITVWTAGCATGEEAYSLAILLDEAGLLAKTRIHATDINNAVLARARTGAFPASHIGDYEDSYRLAGGIRSLDYYFCKGGRERVISPSLAEHLSFRHHNLVSDASLSNVDLIICRNVLIYFSEDLQNSVLNMFADSLVRGGFVCLGANENLAFNSVSPKFRQEHSEYRIYCKL